MCNDKGDLKGFLTNYDSLFLQVSDTNWHLSIRERVRKKMPLYTFEKQPNQFGKNCHGNVFFKNSQWSYEK